MQEWHIRRRDNKEIIMIRSHKRSLAKALTYRFICTTETFIVSWIITGSMTAGGLISAILFFIKIGTYFAHERLWETVKWGKHKEE